MRKIINPNRKEEKEHDEFPINNCSQQAYTACKSTVKYGYIALSGDKNNDASNIFEDGEANEDSKD